jgi:hypothetical protein
MDAVIGTLNMLAYGIPGVVLAGATMLLMVLALVRRESGMMALTALLLVPIAYAAGGWSGFSIVIRLLPVFPLLSAVAIGSDETLFAWLLPLFPFAYLGFYIFTLLIADFSGF